MSDFAGQVVIRTRARQNHLTIEVTDNGVGIPQEIQDRIFDPFFTTKDPDKGTGLGLSIANRIVEAHGGELSATNLDEGGAAFTIDLPRPDGP